MIPQEAKGKHWAIVVFDSRHVEGDERSRTNPGRGYPAHTVQTSEYTPYSSEKRWRAEIERLENRRYATSYIAFEVEPVTIEAKVEIKIGRTP